MIISESASRSVVAPSARRAADPVRRPELELVEAAEREQLEPAVGADEPRDEVVGRMREDAPPACRTARARRPRAGWRSGRPSRIASSMSCVTKMIVLRSSCWMPQELLLETRARDRVERAERLVHEHHRRVGGQRAGEPDALALPARELRGVARRGSRPRAARRGRAARRPVSRSASSASRGGAARWRRCPRPTCAGTARPAG